MVNSLFLAYVSDDNLQTVANSISETINGRTTPEPYKYKTMLTPRYESDLKVSTLSSDSVTVAADIVAMDASLPLKTRDSVSKYVGEIPKMGLKYPMNESTMKKIMAVQNGANNSLQKQITSLIFSDTAKSITAMHETVEYLFHKGLSSGYADMPAENNPGVAIRFDFNYPAKNKYGVEIAWSNPLADPIADIDNVLSAASDRGIALNYMHMSKADFNTFKNNTKVKEFYTASVTKILISGQPLQAPTLADINSALSDTYGLEIVIYNRKMTFEKNKTRTQDSPWEANSVIFTPSMNVGSFVWSDLPEATTPVKQVTYATVDEWILVSKYATTDPFKEFTAVQGFGFPVIENVDSIFKMDIADAVAETQIDNDASFVYKTVTRTKIVVAAALKVADPQTKITATSTDAEIQKAINKLSDAQIAVFEANLV